MYTIDPTRVLTMAPRNINSTYIPTPFLFFFIESVHVFISVLKRTLFFRIEYSYVRTWYSGRVVIGVMLSYTTHSGSSKEQQRIPVYLLATIIPPSRSEHRRPAGRK